MYQISTNRPTWAEIDLNRLAGNLDSIRNFIGQEVEVMAVVKANAYGHGSIDCAKRLEAEGVRWFAVATLEEAVELRQESLTARVLVVGGIWPSQEREFLNFDITPQVIDIAQAEKLNSEAKNHNVVAAIHVKLDTGMNRVGIRPEEWKKAATRFAAMANIRVEGLMTQFAAADKLAENEFTEHQMARFAEAVQLFQLAGHRPEFVDMANSPGAVIYPLSRSKLVRIGGLLYGLADDIIPENVVRPAVKPVMSLFSRVAQVKRVPLGETVGYGRTYKTERDCVIATIPIGYNDGYRRGFSNTAYSVVNGKFAPVAGRNSMDWTTIDVSDCGDVTPGTKVTLIGEEGENKVTAKDLAEICGTISYEITCGIASRVPRIYSGKVV